MLVPRPVHATNVSPAYLYRKCGGEGGPPTILFDEIDAIFGPKAREHEDVRSFLNSGHRRGATFGRCVIYGKRVETEDVQSFAAVALAGLGWLPDSIMTRSVVIRMRRRAPNEHIEAFRHRTHAPFGRNLFLRLEDWAAASAGHAEAARSEMPSGIEDRTADVWEPLLAVADLAGGEWPELARKASGTKTRSWRGRIRSTNSIRIGRGARAGACARLLPLAAKQAPLWIEVTPADYEVARCCCRIPVEHCADISRVALLGVQLVTAPRAAWRQLHRSMVTISSAGDERDAHPLRRRANSAGDGCAARGQYAPLTVLAHPYHRPRRRSRLPVQRVRRSGCSLAGSAIQPRRSVQASAWRHVWPRLPCWTVSEGLPSPLRLVERAASSSTRPALDGTTSYQDKFVGWHQRSSGDYACVRDP